MINQLMGWIGIDLLVLCPFGSESKLPSALPELSSAAYHLALMTFAAKCLNICPANRALFILHCWYVTLRMFINAETHDKPHLALRICLLES